MKANIEARFRIIFLIFISKCINVISKLPLMNSSWVKMDIFPTDLTSVSEEYLCNSCYNHDCCLLSWKKSLLLHKCQKEIIWNCKNCCKISQNLHFHTTSTVQHLRCSMSDSAFNHFRRNLSGFLLLFYYLYHIRDVEETQIDFF